MRIGVKREAIQPDRGEEIKRNHNGKNGKISGNFLEGI